MKKANDSEFYLQQFNFINEKMSHQLAASAGAARDRRL
jgi:hypothetical protein